MAGALPGDGGDPGGIGDCPEGLRHINPETATDLLEGFEHSFFGDRGVTGGDRASRGRDALLGRLGLLLDIGARALQVLPQQLDGLEPQELGERLPLLGLGLVDEVGERPPPQEKRLPARDAECLRSSLVGKDHLSSKLTGGHDRDRGLSLPVAVEVPDGMRPALMGEQLDSAREEPLQGVGDGALAGAVVPVDGDALPASEVHFHLARHPAEGAHGQAMDSLSHRSAPR